MRTFLRGDDCKKGGLEAQKDSFLFRLGVRIEFSESGKSPSSGLLGVLGNAGPKRLSTGLVISESG
jgi:hypothetical protein